MQPMTLRRDPAPSRMSYRMQRLWLTPAFRIFLRHGLPLLVVMGFFGIYLSSPVRRADVVAGYQSIRHAVEHRPEFMVSMMSIHGASTPLADAIRSMLDISFPISSFDLDLKAMRAKIEALDVVASANLQVVAGGVLQVTITQRSAAFVWRTRDGLELIDATGHRVASITSREATPNLPLIAGLGADKAAAEAQAIFAAAGPLAPRIRGLVRVGDRRWNVVLDRDQEILLPEQDPVAALERVIAVDQAQALFAHDITVVDMRLPNRLTLRLSDAAFAARQHALGLDMAAKKAGAQKP